MSRGCGGRGGGRVGLGGVGVVTAITVIFLQPSKSRRRAHCAPLSRGELFAWVILTRGDRGSCYAVLQLLAVYCRCKTSPAFHARNDKSEWWRKIQEGCEDKKAVCVR